MDVTLMMKSVFLVAIALGVPWAVQAFLVPRLGARGQLRGAFALRLAFAVWPFVAVLLSMPLLFGAALPVGSWVGVSALAGLAVAAYAIKARSLPSPGAEAQATTVSDLGDRSA